LERVHSHFRSKISLSRGRFAHSHPSDKLTSKTSRPGNFRSPYKVRLYFMRRPERLCRSSHRIKGLLTPRVTPRRIKSKLAFKLLEANNAVSCYTSFDMLPPILHIPPHLSIFSSTFVDLIKSNSLATVPTSQHMKLLLVNDAQTQNIKSSSQPSVGFAAALLTLAITSRP
jgi:hypothetical protein